MSASAQKALSNFNVDMPAQKELACYEDHCCELPLRGLTHTLTITTVWGRPPGAIGLHEVLCQDVNRMEERQAHLSSREQWRQAWVCYTLALGGEGEHWVQSVTDTDGTEPERGVLSVTGAVMELKVWSRACPPQPAGEAAACPTASHARVRSARWPGGTGNRTSQPRPGRTPFVFATSPVPGRPSR